jgi:hypothetical protein
LSVSPPGALPGAMAYNGKMFRYNETSAVSL